MIITPATRLQDHPEALTLLKLLRHFGYTSAQITQALTHLDGDRPAEKAGDEAFFALLDSRHIDYTVCENGAVVVHGHLNLENTVITTLPDNLSVEGYLNLEDTNITTLPDNLSVGGGLNLSNTNITTLPGNLSVSGHLNLSNTGITTLPDNLSVGGNLYLEDTGITVIPGSVHVGGAILTGAFRADIDGGAA